MRPRSPKDLRAGERKARLRDQMKKKRDSISAASREIKSRSIASEVRKLGVYTKARTIMLYMNIGSEVATKEMIEMALKDGKKVLIPFLGKTKKNIRAAKIVSLEKGLVKGAFGIMEPEPRLCRAVPEENVDMVVVPAVAYDLSCRRIGYGGGYYDRWLKKVPEKARVGVAYDTQVVKEIPDCRGDVKLNMIVTETRVIKRKA